MPTSHKLHIAAEHLARGQLIAYPTEGVWGLGCDPDNRQAVEALIRLKGRRADKGLILIAGSIEQAEPYLSGITPDQRQALQATWPGPVTWLVPNNGAAGEWIVGKHSTLAIRVSDHPLVQALCAAFGGAIVSTSANPSGKPAARDSLRVRMYFGDRLAYILPGPLGGRDKPSQIRDLATNRVLRE